MSTPSKGGAWVSTRPAIRSDLERPSFEAEGLWHIVRLYCAAVGNDGRLPLDDLHLAVGRKISQAKALKLASELAAVPALAHIDDGVLVLDWSDQPKADDWNDPIKRERWARRQRLKRDSELCRRVKERDRNLCRYCGHRVNWNDKVSPKGGTYDHIDPDGDNHFDNVAVSCRRCNGRKRDRTPDQAGMTLLKPGTTADQAQGGDRSRAPDPEGSTSGQPPAGSGPSPPARSRARPDTANPGPTPGQPNPPHRADAHPRRPDASGDPP